MGYDILDSHALKTQLEIFTEEVIKLQKSNKEKNNTLNIVKNCFEQFCSRNGKQKPFTTSTNTYKSRKTDLDITIEDKDTDYVDVKPDVSSSKCF